MFFYAQVILVMSISHNSTQNSYQEAHIGFFFLRLKLPKLKLYHIFMKLNIFTAAIILFNFVCINVL